MTTAFADGDEVIAAAMETCGHAASLGAREYLFHFPKFTVNLQICPAANLVCALNSGALARAADATGLLLWGMAETMSRLFVAREDLFARRCVVELGAGCGLCSIAAGCAHRQRRTEPR